MKRLSIAVLCLVSATAHAQDAYEAGITLSKDERYFAAGNAGNRIHLHSVEDGQLVRTFEFKDALLTKPAFSPDGRYITAGNVGADGGFNPVWRVDDGTRVANAGLYAVKDGANHCNVVGFSGDGKLLLGLVYGLDHTYGTLAWHTSPWAHAYFNSLPADWREGPSAISPQGSLIVSFLKYRTGFWDPVGESGERWKSWEVRWPKEIAYATFSRDGNVIVVGGHGWAGSLDWRDLPTDSGVVYDSAKGIDRTHIVRKSELIEDFVLRSICASSNGKEAFIGSRDGRIARVDLKTGKTLKLWQAFPEPVKGLTQTKGGTILAYDLKTIRYWSPEGVLLKTVDSLPVRRN